LRTLRAYRVRTDRVGELVIARNSCLTYKGRVVDVKQVGRELDVRYVLEGSVGRAGNRTRVTAQLVEAETGKHVWANHYDRNPADIFAVPAADEPPKSQVCNRLLAGATGIRTAGPSHRMRRSPSRKESFQKIGPGSRTVDPS